MPKEIENTATYKVIHPRTGQEVEWSGQRIKCYQIVNRCEVEFPKRKAAAKKSKKAAEETKSENIKSEENGN